MNFSDCLDFCKKNNHVIGTTCRRGNRITHIIPAPNENSGVFHKYLEIALKSDNLLAAAVSVGNINFEPLLILDSPDIMLLYSWYAVEFPENQLEQ